MNIQDYFNLLDFDMINGCFEIRTVPPGTVRVGFFDNVSLAINAINSLNGTQSIYVAPNPRKRGCFIIDNKLLPRSTGGKNTDVLKVNWFLIDIDPERPKESMATEQEVAASKVVLDNVLDFIKSKGIDPVVAFSGSGWHLMIRTIDYDMNIKEKFRLLTLFLKSKFDCPAAKIDIKVHDPARIWKCYYTLAMKGESTTERPHRYAELKYVPEQIIPIDIVEIFKEECKTKIKTQEINVDAIKLEISNEVYEEIIECFKKDNKYIKDEGKFHSVICPWAHLHSADTGQKQTVIYKPDSEHAHLGFSCMHGNHGGEGEKNTSDVLKFYKINMKDVAKRIEDEKFKKESIATLETTNREIQETTDYGLCLEKDFARLEEVCMFVAQDSTGKTWLAMDMAKGFASNKPFWGNRFTPKQSTKVLYFNCDKSKSTFQQSYQYRRFQKLESIQNLVFNHKQSFLADFKKKTGKIPKGFDFSLNNEKAQDILKDYILKEQFKVFIIDSLYGSCTAEFDAAEVRKAIKMTEVFKQISSDCKCFVVFLHHTNKYSKQKGKIDISQEQDEFSGSRQLSAQITYSLGLSKIDKQNRTIHVSNRKEGTLESFEDFDFKIVNTHTLDEQFQDKHFVYLEYLRSDPNSEQIEKERKSKDRILQTMTNFNTPWILHSDLRQAVRPELSSEFYACLEDLVTYKYIDIPLHGKTNRYTLTEKGREQILTPKAYPDRSISTIKTDEQIEREKVLEKHKDNPLMQMTIQNILSKEQKCW